MKNLDLLKKFSVLSPLAPGALLAGCVLIALSGYTPVSVMASGDAASGNAFCRAMHRAMPVEMPLAMLLIRGFLSQRHRQRVKQRALLSMEEAADLLLSAA